MKKLQGVIIPMVTPLDEKEKVAKEDAIRLVEYVLESRISGVFLLGTQGEGPALRHEEKQRLMEIVISQVGKRVPVLVNISDTSTARVIANAQRAEEIGADVLVSSLPYYYPTKKAGEVLNFFKAVVESINTCLCVYDLPGITGAEISQEALLALSHEPRIVGLKDSSGNFHRFRERVFLFKNRADFGIAQGDEWSLDASLLIGADAIVPGIGSLVPFLCVKLYKAAREGQVGIAKSYQEQLLKLFKIYGDNIEFWCAGIKEALRVLGIFQKAQATQPLPQLSEEKRKRVYQIMKDMKLISTGFMSECNKLS